MAALEKHWTNNSTDDFLYRVGADFVAQIEGLMEGRKNQSELAKDLGVTEGRVSQVLNNPGNLTLRKVIEYVRALGKKVSIVTYDDGDPDNQNGPINSQVFMRCWEKSGKPSDLFDTEGNYESTAATDDSGNVFRLVKDSVKSGYIVVGSATFGHNLTQTFIQESASTEIGTAFYNRGDFQWQSRTR